ncbi:nuclear transport factor 2 family protein [Paraburkholderia sp. Tr-20389]|uniref:nuclear transport factor 2 family protein n=1 Tax=Paraburkholderia sp. Tr-20389 TaxID=2703903 RepID=UPI0019809EAB|nr:nuclear transport factor 2 family protein [Paraburkholderia sp. Tr-20389]MBN3752674.1 nuclear transport factor 2 family protein [Paraburkholderia sp. Tr-20389]
MKLHIYLAAPLLAAFALSAPAFAAQNDETVIRQLEENWVQASMHRDTDTLKLLLDDSYREITPSGKARSKSDVLSAPPPPAGSTQTLQNVQVRVDGDQAVVMGENHFMAPNGDAAVFGFKDDFVRRDGQWRVVDSWMTKK